MRVFPVKKDLKTQSSVRTTGAAGSFGHQTEKCGRRTLRFNKATRTGECAGEDWNPSLRWSPHQQRKEKHRQRWQVRSPTVKPGYPNRSEGRTFEAAWRPKSNNTRPSGLKGSGLVPAIRWKPTDDNMSPAPERIQRPGGTSCRYTILAGVPGQGC